MQKAANASEGTQANWTSTQAYILAAFCLVLGVALGYLFRGSASQEGSAANASVPTNVAAPGMGNASAQPSPAQLKEMLDRTAAPLLEAIKKNPKDFDSFVKLGNLYYDGKQYPESIDYYGRALQVHPDNADVRTDLGTAYWYMGDADRAIAEFKKSLKVRPDHPGTLFNMGVVKWQGKFDPAGAVQAWEELLKRNPNYPQRQQVEEFIAKAKEHAKG